MADPTSTRMGGQEDRHKVSDRVFVMLVELGLIAAGAMFLIGILSLVRARTTDGLRTEGVVRCPFGDTRPHV
jgi:hypothetical protein